MFSNTVTPRSVVKGCRLGPLLLVLLLAACARPGREVSVLFVGNSFTSANGLPSTFSGIAKSLGDRAVVDIYAPGGYTFEQHARDATLRRRIAQRAWDFVVLQEQSQRPAFAASQVAREVIPAALTLDKTIRMAHANTKTVFFETWGRRDGDASNCPNLPEICTYEGMQHRLSETYQDLTLRTSATLAPVGQAWRDLRLSHPEVSLYAGDGVHPSPAGTYLAACVFYATLFRKSPAGADKMGLSTSDAELLQRTAERIVLGRP